MADTVIKKMCDECKVAEIPTSVSVQQEKDDLLADLRLFLLSELKPHLDRWTGPCHVLMIRTNKMLDRIGKYI